MTTTLGTLPPSILQHVDELREDSGVRILDGTMRDLKIRIQNHHGGVPVQLTRRHMIANAHWITKLHNGIESLSRPEGRFAHRKVLTLQNSTDDSLMHRLNTALLGGRDYPVLNGLLGIGGGLISPVTGMIFAASTMALSQSSKTHRILARGGDEIWQVEEIGRIRDRSARTPPHSLVHVLSYFLVDPYRKTAQKKAWLIHEERSTISL